MKKYIYGLTITSALFLSSCQEIASFSDMWSDDSTAEEKNMYYAPAPGSTKTSTAPSPATPAKNQVSVPPSYYLANGAPISHQDSDKDWVEQQNPSQYTIQLAANANPSTVAAVLQSAPKNERMAQVKYDDQGQRMYIGLYGSFPNKAAAEAALKKLPANTQTTAEIQPWRAIQEKA